MRAGPRIEAESTLAMGAVELSFTAYEVHGMVNPRVTAKVFNEMVYIKL